LVIIQGDVTGIPRNEKEEKLDHLIGQGKRKESEYALKTGILLKSIPVLFQGNQETGYFERVYQLLTGNKPFKYC
jgi:hypothetical protein